MAQVLARLIQQGRKCQRSFDGIRGAAEIAGAEALAHFGSIIGASKLVP